LPPDMPTIEVTDEQRDRLDALREELAEEFVGRYGTVRPRDAVEYLLDQHGNGDVRTEGVDPEADGETEESTDEGSDGETSADSGGDEDGGGGDDPVADSGEDRLSAMMRLLDDHEGKWRETDSEDGNYEVDLPNGEVTVVRTKDDVRAALFKHY